MDDLVVEGVRVKARRRAPQLLLEDLSDVTIAALRPERPSTPERRLCAAVLGEAILDLCGLQAVARHGALTWVLSEASDLHTFEWVCSNLGFDTEAWRARLLALRPGVRPPGMFIGARNSVKIRASPRLDTRQERKRRANARRRALRQAERAARA